MNIASKSVLSVFSGLQSQAKFTGEAEILFCASPRNGREICNRRGVILHPGRESRQISIMITATYFELSGHVHMTLHVRNSLSEDCIEIDASCPGSDFQRILSAVQCSPDRERQAESNKKSSLEPSTCGSVIIEVARCYLREICSVVSAASPAENVRPVLLARKP